MRSTLSGVFLVIGFGVRVRVVVLKKHKYMYVTVLKYTTSLFIISISSTT